MSKEHPVTEEEIYDLRLTINALIGLIGPQKFAAEKLRLSEQLKDEATELLIRGGGFVRIDEVRPGCVLTVSRCFDGVREPAKQRFPIDRQTEEVQKLFLGKLRNGMVPFEVEGRRGVAVVEDILLPVRPDAC